MSSEVEKGSVIATTAISLCELYAGAYGSRDPLKEATKVEELLSHFRVLELDASASRRYGELANDPELRREPVGDFDLIIAAIALEHAEKLVTRNTRHFDRIPGLEVERW